MYFLPLPAPPPSPLSRDYHSHCYRAQNPERAAGVHPRSLYPLRPETSQAHAGKGERGREKVLTGHRDVDILSPLPSQVGRMAGVDACVTLSKSGEHELKALLVDPAVGRKTDSAMLPPNTGCGQTLGGWAGDTLLTASYEHPRFEWQHGFNLCKDARTREAAQLP